MVVTMVAKRKRTEKVDWQRLKVYIEGQFGAGMAAEHGRAIEELASLREQLCGQSASVDVSERTMQLYASYMALLKSIEKRFPINETELRIRFIWYCSISQSKFSSRYAIVRVI
jgi:BRO1-like domain